MEKKIEATLKPKNKPKNKNVKSAGDDFAPKIYNGFVPISEHLRDSWNLMKSRILKNIVLFILYIITVFLAVGVLVGIYVAAAFFFELFNTLTARSSTFWGIFISAAIITYIVFFSALSAIWQLAIILLADLRDKNVSAVSIFKKSFEFVMPTILVGLAIWLLVFGGFFFFIIPGIIFSFLAVFSFYEVVFERARGFTAIKNSVGIVRQSLGKVLGRMLLIYASGFLMEIFMNLSNGILGDQSGLLISLVFMAMTLVISLITPFYMYILYKQARSVYDESKKTSTTWMWVISVLGFIFAGLVIAVITSAARNYIPEVIDYINRQDERGAQEEMEFLNEGIDLENTNQEADKEVKDVMEYVK